MEVSKSPHCPSCLPSMYYNSPFVLSAPLAMKNSWCCNVLVLGLMCCHSPLGPPRGDGGVLAVGRSPACTTSMLLEPSPRLEAEPACGGCADLPSCRERRFPQISTRRQLGAGLHSNRFAALLHRTFFSLALRQLIYCMSVFCQLRWVHKLK